MSTSTTLARCYFLDVGQGTSQVVLLPERKALVIDGGRDCRVLLDFLGRKVDEIVALIVSHNDEDHQAGARGILEQWTGTIRRVYMLIDREVDRIGLFALADRMEREGRIELDRLERGREAGPNQLLSAFPIYEDPDRGIALDVIFPRFRDNPGEQGASPNARCAILALYVAGECRILFPGDSTLDAWERVNQRFGAPIDCDIFAVPHHGGKTWSGRLDAPEEESLLDAFYAERVRFRHAIVSAGTGNGHNHPRPTVIRAVRRSDGSPTVLCTQLTSGCGDLDVVRGATDSGLIPPSEFSDCHPTKRGRRAPLGCAGTIAVDLAADDVTVDRLTEHQDAIDRWTMHSWWRPLCRTPSSPA